MPKFSSPHLNAVLISVALAVAAYLLLIMFWKRRSLSVDTVLHGIDEISVFVGKTGAWAILILTFAMCYEVFSRYLLQAPTDWAFDASYILYGALSCWPDPTHSRAMPMCAVIFSTGNGRCGGRPGSISCSISSSFFRASSRFAMRDTGLRPSRG
jgi:hypothetical protein